MSTRNRAAFLPDVLRTLAAQQCGCPFEVVVIDNASTDDTAAVVESWCRTDRRFRYGFEPRLGLSCGKNAGIRMARAPLLLFTDDDVMVEPQWIQSYVDLFESVPAGAAIAGGPILPIPDDLDGWPEWFNEAAKVDLAYLNHHDQRALHDWEWLWGANMAVPRRLFDRFGGWDESIGRNGTVRGTFEDTEFQERVKRAGVSVWFCPAAVVHHRVPRRQITARRISSSAFARGRHQVWQSYVPVSRDVALAPRQNLAVWLGALSWNLARWAYWTLVFRGTGLANSYERARHAAFVSGQSLGRLHLGRKSAGVTLAISQIAFKVRGLVLRLSPDAA
jgi:GT2 family glycosyltransferase